MKVAGFTIARNVVKYDYPLVEAILSVLPLCDEFVVAVGDSEDETLEVITNIKSDKIRIINSTWDMTLREGGKVLAAETNKALDAVSPDADWAFYIQADEVLHEDHLPVVLAAMKKHLNDHRVEGLLFRYRHFYGSYDYVADSRKWYRKEIRVIRNDKSIRSYRDAQGFRKKGRKLQVKEIPAWIFHYGWVKPPDKQQAKQESFHKMWHDDEWMEKNIPKRQEFDYSGIDSLALFKGTHPQVMQERIRKRNWKFDFDLSKKNLKFPKNLLYWVEKQTGWKIGEYRNYKKL